LIKLFNLSLRSILHDLNLQTLIYELCGVKVINTININVIITNVCSSTLRSITPIYAIKIDKNSMKGTKDITKYLKKQILPLLIISPHR
jgi:hypothetical protein